jgi:hypothetical protein
VPHYLEALFHAKNWLSISTMLGLPIIMGASIYAVKKWSYSVFVASSTWMLIRNFPTYEGSKVNLAFAITFYLLNISLVSYFLLPEVRRQFFDARVRWWETATRYLVNFGAKFEYNDHTETCEIRDISVGGVFAQMPKKISSGEIVRLRFSPNGKHIFSIKAKVVFHRDGAQKSGPATSQNSVMQYGHGLQFVELTSATQQMLSELAQNLRASGYPSRSPGDSDWDDFKKWAVQFATTGRGMLPQYPQMKSVETAQVATETREDQAA